MDITRREMLQASVLAGCALAVPGLQAESDKLVFTPQKYRIMHPQQEEYHTLAIDSFKDCDRIKDNRSLKNDLNLLNERRFQCSDEVLKTYLNDKFWLKAWSIWETPGKPGSVEFFQVTDHFINNVPSKRRFKVVSRDTPIMMITNHHNLLIIGKQIVLHAQWIVENPEHLAFVCSMKNFCLSDND